MVIRENNDVYSKTSKDTEPIISASEEGHPIYSYGQFDIYAVSPTYIDDLNIQKENDNPFYNIKPKKS